MACTINPPVPGFRVQLTNVSTKNQALAFARFVSGDSNFPVYVIQKDGAWKVRLGDFETIAEAELARSEMANKGYLDMWIVEDLVTRIERDISIEFEKDND
ncbi:SPOR domain-containing protein [bacterium]|nr:SPOR domain-containing protein [bacterium]